MRWRTCTPETRTKQTLIMKMTSLKAITIATLVPITPSRQECRPCTLGVATYTKQQLLVLPLPEGVPRLLMNIYCVFRIHEMKLLLLHEAWHQFLFASVLTFSLDIFYLLYFMIVFSVLKNKHVMCIFHAVAIYQFLQGSHFVCLYWLLLRENMKSSN